MTTKTDKELLVIYDALPSLLDIATEQAKATGGYAYDIQNKLRDEYLAEGKIFKMSMLYRSLFECFQCGLMTTQIQHTLFNPHMRKIDSALFGAGLSEEELHHIREHGAAFSEQCRKFLEHVSDQFNSHLEISS